MRWPIHCALALLAAAAWAAPGDDLAAIRSIGDPERRSTKALDFARDQLDRATEAFRLEDLQTGRDMLGALADAVELAVESLESTGKHPRRHPKHFKRAEIRTRRLIEALRQARHEAHPDDQPEFDQALGRVEDANGRLLLGIMGPKQ